MAVYIDCALYQTTNSILREALKEWSYTDAVIRKIAEQAKGNMALAINTLRTAALRAEGQNKTKIEEEDVPVNNCPMLELNQDEAVLLKILKERRSLPNGKLYALYKEKVRTPKSKRVFRNYMHLGEERKVL